MAENTAEKPVHPQAETVGDGWLWPIPDYRSISRAYDDIHLGMDITGSMGINIYAVRGGTVSKAVYGNRGHGIYVKVEHDDGTTSLYAHCSGLAVRVGDTVSTGDLIAYLGNTGNSAGPHCHLEIWQDGEAIDPATLLDIPEV